MARAIPCLFVLLAACGGSGSAAESSAGDAAAPTPTPTADAGSDAASPSVDASASGDGSTSGDAAPTPGGDSGSAGTATFTLSFVPGSAYDLFASIGGGAPHEVQLDTGSIGLYVPKSVVGPSAQISTTDTCSITYVSSGNMLSGHTATATVTLLGSKASGDLAAPPTTAPMTFCAVDDPTWHGGMMGVGYGRGTKADPTRNVLLQIAEIAAGTMHPGFVLSTHPSPTLELGLTAANSSAFKTIALKPDPSGDGDWLSTSLRGCLALPKQPGFTTECGPLLVDTGVPETILWGPTDPTLGGAVASGQTTAPNGTSVAISTESDPSALDFAFVVGSGADSPSAVDIRTASAFSINTGRALLVDYDYLFDARAGLVGFRRAP